MSANADGPTATSCRITTSSGAMCSVATCSKRQRSQQTLSRNRRSVSRKLWLPPPVAMLVRPEDVGFGRVAWRGPPFSAVLPSGVGTPRQRPLLAFRHSTYSPIPTAPPEYTIPSRTTSSCRSPNARHEPRASARRLHALVRRSRGQIFAQRPCPIRICRATSEVTPPKVVVEGVLAGLETRSRVAGVPYGGFGECQKDRADPAAGARRRDIQRRDAVSVHFYPADRSPFHGHPHVMFPHRPRHAICCPSRGPSFGLFPRHRWYSQRENCTPPYTCERFLVSGLGAPNLHQVATTWPNAAVHLRPPERPEERRRQVKRLVGRKGDRHATSMTSTSVSRAILTECGAMRLVHTQ